MKILTEKRCIIGEGPIWNEGENCIYFTNGYGKEYCVYSLKTGKTSDIPLEKDCAAFAFTKDNKMIVSRSDGVFILNRDGNNENIYDTSVYKISNANDMKAGPDGRLYVGTQSEKRIGISNNTNGKLYSIDKCGKVTVLLDGLSLSNGMDWSADERFFYHTDSDSEIIKEYNFNREQGKIEFTGRKIKVDGVDGFTVSNDNKIYAACWGKGHIAVVDIKRMRLERYIEIPCRIPSSCSFIGENSDILAITTASYGADIKEDKYAGYTILLKIEKGGRKPYLFG